MGLENTLSLTHPDQPPITFSDVIGRFPVDFEGVKGEYVLGRNVNGSAQVVLHSPQGVELIGDYGSSPLAFVGRTPERFVYQTGNALFSHSPSGDLELVYAGKGIIKPSLSNEGLEFAVYDGSSSTVHSDTPLENGLKREITIPGKYLQQLGRISPLERVFSSEIEVPGSRPRQLVSINSRPVVDYERLESSHIIGEFVLTFGYDKVDRFPGLNLPGVGLGSAHLSSTYNPSVRLFSSDMSVHRGSFSKERGYVLGTVLLGAIDSPVKCVAYAIFEDGRVKTTSQPFRNIEHHEVVKHTSGGQRRLVAVGRLRDTSDAEVVECGEFVSPPFAEVDVHSFSISPLDSTLKFKARKPGILQKMKSFTVDTYTGKILSV